MMGDTMDPMRFRFQFRDFKGEIESEIPNGNSKYPNRVRIVRIELAEDVEGIGKRGDVHRVRFGVSAHDPSDVDEWLELNVYRWACEKEAGWDFGSSWELEPNGSQ
jgi:hypothetical protein